MPVADGLARLAMSWRICIDTSAGFPIPGLSASSPAGFLALHHTHHHYSLTVFARFPIMKLPDGCRYPPIVSTSRVRGRLGGTQSNDGVVVLADSARIRQALLALLDNVVRYASDGRWVRVETRASATEGLIRVIDRGPGLPASFSTRAFDAFTRADESRSRAGVGTGLGLAVVQAIARSHGDTARSLTGARCSKTRYP